jgi:hypothetical protein
MAARPLTMDWRLVTWPALALLAVGIALAAPDISDSLAYYTFPWPPDYSEASPYGFGWWVYSPAFAWWVQPFQALPFEWFRLLIVGPEVAALAYLVGPLAAIALIVFQAPLVYTELSQGNVNLIMAVLLLWAVQRPGWLSVPALTKAAPAMLGLWHVARGEWRAVGIAAGVIVAFALPSMILAPDAWIGWLGSLVGTSSEAQLLVPTLLRFAFAAGIVVYAARTDRAWLALAAMALTGPHNHPSWLLGLGAWRAWRSANVAPTGR